MKPSERITQLTEKFCLEFNYDENSLSAFPLVVQAIIVYLDEEYERNRKNEM